MPLIEIRKSELWICEAKAEGIFQQQQRLAARLAALDEKTRPVLQTEPMRRGPVTTAARRYGGGVARVTAWP